MPLLGNERPGVRGRKPRPPKPDIDLETARELAKGVTKKQARDKFVQVIDEVERRGLDIRDHQRRAARRETRLAVKEREVADLTAELAVKREETELRRIDLGGLGILLPVDAKPGDLYWHPDGRVWKLAEGGATFVLVGDSG